MSIVAQRNQPDDAMPPDLKTAQGDLLRFYTCPRNAWRAMLDDCAAATVSIEFDQYILNNDEVGLEFLRLFTEKAKKGLIVRISLDTVGSRTIRNAPEMAEYRRAGGVVYFFNQLSWYHIAMPWTWFPRNHCKTLLVDNRIAYIGSVCIEKIMAGWRDTHVRYEGPLTKDIDEDFHRLWQHRRGQLTKPHFRRIDRLAPFQYVTSRPGLGKNPIYRELLHQIKRAKSRVYLATPYFLPPYRLRRALRAAVRRGVDVRVMMSEASDVAVADRVAHSFFPQLLRKGIAIHLYRGTVMHAKFSVIDDWATVGSTNIDYLSLRRNREANLVMRDPVAVAAVAEQFHHDLQTCYQVDRLFWHNLCWRDKCLGYAGRLMKRLL